MKTIVYLIIFIFSSIGFSQGNLQFNQVVTEMKTTNFSGVGGAVLSTTFTVPTGKVWKVEGLYQNVANNIGALSGPSSYIVNNLNPNHLLKTYTDNNILWLPSGNYQIRYYWGCGSTNCSGTVYNTINSIEFNVVQ